MLTVAIIVLSGVVIVITIVFGRKQASDNFERWETQEVLRLQAEVIEAGRRIRTMIITEGLDLFPNGPPRSGYATEEFHQLFARSEQVRTILGTMLLCLSSGVLVGADAWIRRGGEQDLVAASERRVEVEVSLKGSAGPPGCGRVAPR